MANQEHFDILAKGVEMWNEWREEHTDIRPELTGADMSGANLSGANLHQAHFDRTRLFKANLSRANLRQAHFYFADLYGADLSEANLSRAYLAGSELTQADLRDVDFTQADLSEANMNNALMGWTVLGRVDLSVVKGLETVEHAGPSTIGIDTIFHSHGNISEVFLKGAGVDDTFITYIRSLVGKAIEYYSCFISYSSKDNAFARRLYNDLQSHNVRCWFAPEDLKIGEKFWHRIDKSIRLYDKLLVVLSKFSVESNWVEREVVAALEKEQQQRKLVLFPITLDETFKHTVAPWAADLRRQRHIGDFTHWKNYDEYQNAFKRLLRDLKAETKSNND